YQLSLTQARLYSSVTSVCSYCYHDIRDLHSFPTRRSSDLISFERLRRRAGARRKGGARDRDNPASGLGHGRRDLQGQGRKLGCQDRKSTRLNSSHSQISYAVFCLKKKNQIDTPPRSPYRSA